MVTRKLLIQTALVLVIVLSVTPIVLDSIVVKAADIEYYLNHEYAKIWINTDGTIDLFYNITITCTQEVIHYVKVGQPKGDFTIGAAKDEGGHNLTTSVMSSGGDYKVRVNLYTPISAGQSASFTLLTNVGHMIWEDEDNPGNVGMQFIPCWWDARVDELRIAVVFPEGVTNDTVGLTPNWTGTSIEEGRFVLYWEKHNLQPSEQFPCGVSFPEEYVEYYDVRGKGID